MKSPEKEKAIKTFQKSYNCAQAIFSAYSKKVGIKRKDSIRISAGFGGGIAMNQEICGALSGAIMLIGCRYFDSNDVKESKELVYQKVNNFLSEFHRIHGSIKCKDLIGVDFSNKEELEKARSENLFNKICTNYIKNICDLLENRL